MPYTLPPLPFASDALEPYIDKQTMEIHHGKHHAAYVTNLNAAIAKHPELDGKPMHELLKGNLRSCPRTSRRPCATTAAVTTITRSSGRSSIPRASPGRRRWGTWARPSTRSSDR